MDIREEKYSKLSSASIFQKSTSELYSPLGDCLAESLTFDKEIAFNAGSHTELIRLSYADYARLVKPRIFKFTWKTVSFPGDPSERWQDDI